MGEYRGLWFDDRQPGSDKDRAEAEASLFKKLTGRRIIVSPAVWGALKAAEFDLLLVEQQQTIDLQ